MLAALVPSSELPTRCLASMAPVGPLPPPATLPTAVAGGLFFVRERRVCFLELLESYPAPTGNTDCTYSCMISSVLSRLS